MKSLSVVVTRLVAAAFPTRARGRTAMLALVAIAIVTPAAPSFAGGLKRAALADLHKSGVDRYLGKFKPATSEPMGEWVKHTFDTLGGDGPMCINGTPFTAFSRARDPRKLMIVLDGGGACWQGFYACSITADDAPPRARGYFADNFDAGGGQVIENPLTDWSIVYLSYCDGSTFNGDNTVVDPSFPAGGVRYHRGARNVTAGIDLAKELFRDAKKILLTGYSAGGYGVAGVAPFVVRFSFGNSPQLFVLNDSGPGLVNLAEPSDVQARLHDWAYQQFVPSTCTDCTTDKQPAELIEWMLENDNRVRAGLVTSDGDSTIGGFYLRLPTPLDYRNLLLNTHGPINDHFPRRYKRFIFSGTTHTATETNLFYTTQIDGVPLYEWTGNFVDHRKGWKDLVDDFEPGSPSGAFVE